MNLFILKYCILIGAILTSSALVAGPLNPLTLVSEKSVTDSGEISADAIYQFGSETFYKELDKPGNEYLKANTEGYSKELIPTEKQEETFAARWEKGLALFGTGYRGSTDTFFSMAAIPEMKDDDQKVAVCGNFRQAKEDLRMSEQYFLAAKASASAGSASGFTIGMVIPRISRVAANAEDAELSCMRAVLADRKNDPSAFKKSLDETGASLRDSRLQYAELKVLSEDFNEL
jgi:hypothetical protein